MKHVSAKVGWSDWTDDIVAVLVRGPVRLQVMYFLIEARRKKIGRSWTAHSKATIRCHLQCHCKTSRSYREGWDDLFRNPAKGIWRLK